MAMRTIGKRWVWMSAVLAGVAARSGRAAGDDPPSGALLIYTFDRDALVSTEAGLFAADLSGRQAHARVEQCQPREGIAGEALGFAERTVVRVPEAHRIQEAAAFSISYHSLRGTFIDEDTVLVALGRRGQAFGAILDLK